MNLELHKNLIFDVMDDLASAKEIGNKDTAQNIEETLKTYPEPKKKDYDIVKFAYLCIYNSLNLLELYNKGFIPFKLIKSKISVEMESALSALSLSENLP